MKHPRVVVCAAVQNKEGKILCGARHWDSVMRGIGVVDEQMIPEWRGAKQGFIDQFGVFMDRQEAYEVAYAAGQIKYGCSGSIHGTLYSEDLY